MGSPARTLHLARPHHGARTITVERRESSDVLLPLLAQEV